MSEFNDRKQLKKKGGREGTLSFSEKKPTSPSRKIPFQCDVVQSSNVPEAQIYQTIHTPTQTHASDQQSTIDSGKV